MGDYIKRGNLTTSLILLVLQGICSGLFAAGIMGKINKLIGLGGSITAALKFSVFGGYMQTLLYSLILSVIFAGLLLAGCKLMHCELQFPQALSAASVCTVVCIPLTLLSWIVLFISVPVGLFLFYLVGGLVKVIVLTVVINSIQTLTPNKKVYLTLAVAVALLIVFVLGARLLGGNFIPSVMKNQFSWSSILRSLT